MAEVLNANALVEKFDAYLKSKGMRRTPERFKILEQVINLPKQFVIEDLDKAMSDSAFIVSKSTLYNTVDLFVEADLLRRVVIDNGPFRYERVDDVRYIHLVCDECRKIKLVKDLNFMAYMNARKFPAFTTHDYNLTVHGVCNDCARRIKREKRMATAKQPKQRK